MHVRERDKESNSDECPFQDPASISPQTDTVLILLNRIIVENRTDCRSYHRTTDPTLSTSITFCFQLLAPFTPLHDSFIGVVAEVVLNTGQFFFAFKKGNASMGRSCSSSPPHLSKL